MTFLWPATPVRLVGDQFLRSGPPHERPNEALEAPGFWMRLAQLRKTNEQYKAFASEYGLLRRDGERIADWALFAGLLERCAVLWGDRRRAELPPPDPHKTAALELAHGSAAMLRHMALEEGDVRLVPGTTDFVCLPSSLAGLLTLQVTSALHELPHFVKCRRCKGWFARGRADQRYCLDRHRWAHHNRERREP
jgi:hypothetical protein